MSYSWDPGKEQLIEKPSAIGWVLVFARTTFVAITIFGLMIPLILVRWIGLKSFGQRIVQFASRMSLRILGIRLRIIGEPMQSAGAVVANHSSWLDIFSLNAVQRVYFVSKADVSDWPLIGAIARSTGTVFIKRRASDAANQRRVFNDHIKMGHKLLFFPEGTSTDGQRVLPFRSSLFAAFFDANEDGRLWVQPVTVHYCAPEGVRRDLYGWWGGMGFAPHFAMVASRLRQGKIDVHFHAPLKVADFKDRKMLAAACEESVRAGFPIN